MISRRIGFSLNLQFFSKSINKFNKLYDQYRIADVNDDGYGEDVGDLGDGDGDRSWNINNNQNDNSMQNEIGAKLRSSSS